MKSKTKIRDEETTKWLHPFGGMGVIIFNIHSGKKFRRKVSFFGQQNFEIFLFNFSPKNSLK
jgi:hypothetical protein